MALNQCPVTAIGHLQCQVPHLSGPEFDTCWPVWVGSGAACCPPACSLSGVAKLQSTVPVVSNHYYHHYPHIPTSTTTATPPLRSRYNHTSGGVRWQPAHNICSCARATMSNSLHIHNVSGTKREKRRKEEKCQFVHSNRSCWGLGVHNTPLFNLRGLIWSIWMTWEKRMGVTSKSHAMKSIFSPFRVLIKKTKRNISRLSERKIGYQTGAVGDYTRFHGPIAGFFDNLRQH